MRKILTTLFAVSALSSHAQISNPAPYCASVFDNNYNMIERVKIKGAQQTFGPMGSWTSTNQYAYYNSLNIPTFTKGDTASISINFYGVNDAEPMYFAVYIDYNRNNAFEANEVVMQNNNTTNAALNTFVSTIQTVTKTITVPTSASTGVTRMRITRGSEPNNLFQYNNSVTMPACNALGNQGYGCSYDFNITLAARPNATADLNTPQTPAFYPNPSNGILHLVNSSQPQYIRVLDAMGRVVLAKPNFLGTDLDLSHLSSGIYTVELTLESGQRSIQKLELITF